MKRMALSLMFLGIGAVQADEPAAPAQQEAAQYTLQMPSQADFGYCLDVNTLTQKGCLGVPVVDVNGVVQLGILALQSSKTNAGPYIDLNVKTIISSLGSKLGLTYLLPGSIVVGYWASYDIISKSLFHGPKVAYRFGFGK